MRHISGVLAVSCRFVKVCLELFVSVWKRVCPHRTPPLSVSGIFLVFQNPGYTNYRPEAGGPLSMGKREFGGDIPRKSPAFEHLVPS